MFKLVCPSCSLIFRGNLVEKIYGPCPECHYIVNRRKFERKVFEKAKKEIPIRLELGDKAQIAEAIDMSNNGIGIIIHNPTFVKKGEQVRCNFGNNGEMEKAIVAWTLVSEGKQRVGLSFHSSIVNSLSTDIGAFVDENDNFQELVKSKHMCM